MSTEVSRRKNRALRVLVVDDDPIDRLFCKTCLESSEDQQYEVVETGSGASALEMLKTESFDCMLLDQNLPDVTGIELLERMRQNALISRIAVIILTGQDTVEVAAQALRGGASDYLQKKMLNTLPLDRAIANATEKVRLEQAIFQEREVLSVANEQLRAKHREIQNFYHQVSHELRTPLTSLREFVSIVADGLAENPDEEQEYLNYAIESCDRLSGLVEDLLDATRLESGKLRLRIEEIELTVLFGLLERTVAGLAREAEVDVHYCLQPGIPNIWADPERMLQVLTIFMTNAIKFTPAQGEVTVNASVCSTEGQHMVRLAVKDNGCGIAEDYQEAVFSRLFQVEQIEHEASSGLGLGLSIAKEIVEQHSGTIGVESKPGIGSDFYICIPAEKHRRS